MPAAQPAKGETRLNCYGLAPKQWDDVCNAATDIHMKLVEVKAGEDAFDEESLILSKGLAALYLVAALAASSGTPKEKDGKPKEDPANSRA